MAQARGSRFQKAAVAKADEIGQPVDEETREEARQSSVDPAPQVHEEGKGLTEGLCEGGPMAGLVGQSRCPKGFVVIDSVNSRAWVYDYDAERNVFVSRKRDVHDRIRGLKAAEEGNYDVRAYDRVLMRRGDNR